MDETKAGGTDRIWLYLALAFGLFWAGYLMFLAPTGGTPGRGDPGSSALAEPADYSWKLLDLDDQPVEFSKFRGKAVFLNVWATWCGPCVREMPSIAALAADPRLKDVAFVCVSSDDSAATVKQFLDGKGWPMTILRATEAPRVFTTEGIPATFLIAPDGRIASAEVGSADWNTPKVVAFLEGLARPAKP